MSALALSILLLGQAPAVPSVASDTAPGTEIRALTVTLVDDKGQEGLELAFDALTGFPASLREQYRLVALLELRCGGEEPACPQAQRAAKRVAGGADEAVHGRARRIESYHRDEQQDQHGQYGVIRPDHPEMQVCHGNPLRLANRVEYDRSGARNLPENFGRLRTYVSNRFPARAICCE